MGAGAGLCACACSYVGIGERLGVRPCGGGAEVGGKWQEGRSAFSHSGGFILL